MERYIHEDLSVKISVLQKLPHNSRIIVLVWVKNMSNQERKAMLVLSNEPVLGIRKAYFDLETGEYLGEAF